MPSGRWVERADAVHRVINSERAQLTAWRPESGWCTRARGACWPLLAKTSACARIADVDQGVAANRGSLVQAAVGARCCGWVGMGGSVIHNGRPRRLSSGFGDREGTERRWLSMAASQDGRASVKRGSTGVARHRRCASASRLGVTPWHGASGIGHRASGIGDWGLGTDPGGHSVWPAALRVAVIHRASSIIHGRIAARSWDGSWPASLEFFCPFVLNSQSQGIVPARAD